MPREPGGVSITCVSVNRQKELGIGCINSRSSKPAQTPLIWEKKNLETADLNIHPHTRENFQPSKLLEGRFPHTIGLPPDISFVTVERKIRETILVLPPPLPRILHWDGLSG